MFLFINKPKGITSHDVVDRVRRISDERKVGHAGTLDPNATGLLIVGIGRNATKKLGFIAKDTTKTYEAEIILGEERDTDDVEGKQREILRLASHAQDDIVGSTILPTMSSVNKVLESFVGEQKQIPPAYSAIKMKGRKAYQLARQGREVLLSSRDITIYSIKLLDYRYPLLTITCEVSSGTYIRSLARDIGRKLHTGAYLNNLIRLGIGKYTLEQTVNLNKLTSQNWKDFVFKDTIN